MFRVDKNLCTGCGLCAEACRRGAISLEGPAAVIDETRCTSCGLCADFCMTGAIAPLPTDAEQYPSGAPALRPALQPYGAGAPARSFKAPGGAARRRGRGKGRGPRRRGEAGAWT